MALSLVLLYVGIAASVCFVVSLIMKRRKTVKLGSKLPGPPAYPILGNSLTFAGVNDVEDLWNIVKELASRENGIHRYWLGPLLVIIVDDPVFANVVATHSASANKHPWYSVFSFGENGVFTTNGKHYERLRKALNPSFHPKTVTNWHDLVAAKAVQAIEFLAPEDGKGEFDISDMTSAFSLDVVCNTILGADLNEMKEKRFNFHHALNEATAISIQRLFKPQYFIDFIFKMSKTGKKFQKCCIETTALVRHIIEKRIKELESRGIDLKGDFEVEHYTDSIIKIGCKQGLTLEEMARMLCDIPVAGSDTTAISSAFVLLYLAMHPEYQQEAYKEQIAVLGDTDRAPTVEELGRMPFLSWIEKEVQRLQGPPLIARYSEDDMEIGGYAIPKGTTLAILLHKLHRNQQFYEKPDDFYPYHFSPESVAKRPKNSFIPLSNGARRCPGGLFSHLSVTTLVSVLLRSYEFTTSRKYNEIKFKYSLMLESANGYPVKISKRPKPIF